MRKSGYYWVRVHYSNNDWEISECFEDYWYRMNDEMGYKDSDFDEIDETPIERNKI